MELSKLTRTLEMGIPVIIDNKIWRIINNILQMGVTASGEPAYIGNHNDCLCWLAEQIDEKEEFFLSYLRVLIKINGRLPEIFSHEQEHFRELGCNNIEDYESFSTLYEPEFLHTEQSSGFNQ